jgi:hypothetical protein
VGITLLHELIHLLVAHLFGYRLLAWGPVTLGAFVLFDDTFDPDWHPLYWPLQLIVPWLTTAATLPLVWLLAFQAAGLDWEMAGRLAISPVLLMVSLLASALGSIGDLILVLQMPRLATREPDLTLRDMKTHQKFGARPIFTRYGRDALQRRYGMSANEVWERARTLPPARLFNKPENT